jgi:hypothetical protein
MISLGETGKLRVKFGFTWIQRTGQARTRLERPSSHSNGLAGKPTTYLSGKANLSFGRANGDGAVDTRIGGLSPGYPSSPARLNTRASQVRLKSAIARSWRVAAAEYHRSPLPLARSQSLNESIGNPRVQFFPGLVPASTARNCAGLARPPARKILQRWETFDLSLRPESAVPAVGSSACEPAA